MGKKRSRPKYTSKGQRSNVAKDTLKMVATGMESIDKGLNIIRAWKKGQNPWITVENTGGQTNKRFIKVKANDLYGNPKNATYGIFRGKEAQ